MALEESAFASDKSIPCKIGMKFACHVPACNAYESAPAPDKQEANKVTGRRLKCSVAAQPKARFQDASSSA